MGEYSNFTISDGVATLTLNRPDKRNALKREFLVELNEAVQQVADNRSLRVLVLKAEGGVFCAGMDLAQMQQRAEADNGGEEYQIDSQVYCDLLKGIYSLTIPTIAAVQGPALAGGFGIVLACDMVVASDTAFFMLPEPVRGITAAMVTPLLILRSGEGPATYMLLSNERVSANQAANFGICHSVVSPSEFPERVQKLVDSVLLGSQEALFVTKKHIGKCSGKCTVEGTPGLINMSIHISAQARETDDAREGLAAFLEKRKPRWQVSDD